MAALNSLLTVLWSLTAGRGRDDEGQTMAEYGLILAGIAVIVMAAVFLLGGVIDTTFRNIAAQF